MKKIILTLISFIFLIIISLITLLSTLGIETNKFNNLISKKINQTNKSINLKLNTIKFKFDIKEISLFLETNDPFINYRDIAIPAKNIKVYIDFASLIKTDPKIKKIYLAFNQLNIEQLKKISVTFKPSNFTSFVNNKIKKGKINAEVEVYFDKNNLFENFIARGSITNLNAEIVKNITLEKTNFSFFADKSDVILKNINSQSGPIKIKDGDLKVNLSSEIKLESNFKTNLKYSTKSINYKNLLKNFKFTENITSLEAELNNSFFINFDQTYKVKKYNYKTNGKILKANLNFNKPIKNFFLDKKINQLSLINSEIETNFSSKKNTTNISGKYALNEEKFLSYNLENIISGELINLKLNADYSQPFEVELINYK
ncbi:hypothetical protein OAS35_03035, partial [Pelagibacteraceae bacterium]|nr:hypothetical protein [Pelagibacteraceae bacterium]